MITNYAGIEQAEKNTKEIEKEYKAMLEYGRGKTREGNMLSFDYSGYHLPSDKMRVKQQCLRRLGCLGGLIALAAVMILIGLAVWYPASWLAIAIIGVPILMILGTVLSAVGFTARL